MTTTLIDLDEYRDDAGWLVSQAAFDVNGNTVQIVMHDNDMDNLDVLVNGVWERCAVDELDELIDLHLDE